MTHYPSRLGLAFLFAVAMAAVESAVVVYLRAIYYPEGFSVILKAFTHQHQAVEIGREFATIVMLITVAGMLGRERWERFGWFIFLFGVWDIFYYVWLKVMIDWPLTLTDFDILFLIPAPWVGPVIAPVLVSALMIYVGILLTRLYKRNRRFRCMPTTWILALVATAVILYSFLRDADNVLSGTMPDPYWYPLLFLGLALYGVAFWWSYRRTLG